MNTKTNAKIIVVILMLIIVIIILSALLITNSKFIIPVEAKNIIYGIAGGIATFAITFYITQKLFYENNDKYEDLIKTFNPHDIDSKTILNTVQKKSIVLVALDRKDLLRKGYYEKKYSNANDIRISGITVNALIEYLCNPKPSNNHLICQLKTRRNVSVRIVLMHPESKIVDILNEQEHSEEWTAAEKIKKSIDNLKRFSNRRNGKLAKDSSIEVVVTKQTMNFTISYYGNEVRNSNDDLLLGFLFGSKVGGPMYKVPMLTEISMYDDCLNHFNELFNNGTQIFSWKESKKIFTPI